MYGVVGVREGKILGVDADIWLKKKEYNNCHGSIIIVFMRVEISGFIRISLCIW